MSETIDAAATRPSLLVRIRNAQDSDAWQDFVSLYGAMIQQYCLRRQIQEADAAEITQEVLLQVSRSIATFTYDPQRGRFRNWLAAIVRTKLIGLVRCNQRYQAQSQLLQDLDLADGATDGQWVDVWQSQLLSHAIQLLEQRMTANTFTAFRATWLEDRPAGEVAASMGQPVSWVYIAKSRGLKGLRELLTELAGESALTEPR